MRQNLKNFDRMKFNCDKFHGSDLNKTRMKFHDIHWPVTFIGKCVLFASSLALPLLSLIPHQQGFCKI